MTSATPFPQTTMSAPLSSREQPTSRKRPAPRGARVVHMTSVHNAIDGRIFYKECRSLERAGFHVTSIGPHPGDAVIDRVHIKSIRKDQNRLARMTRTVWRVYREALKQDADVYHFHDPELIPVGLLLQAQGKKVIYDLHEDYPKGVLSKSYLPEWSRRGISWMIAGLEQAACRRFSALVAVTPSIAARFAPVNRRTVVVYNYPEVKDLILAHPSPPWHARKQAVVYTGGIQVLRGIREMVAAMELLPESLGATLELVGPFVPGEVPYDELTSRPGWARVRPYGLVDQPTTFRVLYQSRAGLALYHRIPNQLESLPQKIFEYMGAGLPVIASDVPLWRRIISEGGCGIVVDPRDPRAIARAIQYLLENPAEAEAMGQRGRAAILDHYNWDVQAQELVNLYKNLLECKG
jgi:glycosyltransferase involved in cell wall biosynthesis